MTILFSIVVSCVPVTIVIIVESEEIHPEESVAVTEYVPVTCTDNELSCEASFHRYDS